MKKYCIYKASVYPIEKMGKHTYVDINGKKHVDVYIAQPINKFVAISIDNIFKSKEEADKAVSKQPNLKYETYKNEIITKNDLIYFALTHELIGDARRAFVDSAKEFGITAE